MGSAASRREGSGNAEDDEFSVLGAKNTLLPDLGEFVQKNPWSLFYLGQFGQIDFDVGFALEEIHRGNGIANLDHHFEIWKWKKSIFLKKKNLPF